MKVKQIAVFQYPQGGDYKAQCKAAADKLEGLGVGITAIVIPSGNDCGRFDMFETQEFEPASLTGLRSAQEAEAA